VSDRRRVLGRGWMAVAGGCMTRIGDRQLERER
jgi:hypothetical protein